MMTITDINTYIVSYTTDTMSKDIRIHVLNEELSTHHPKFRYPGHHY